MKDLFGALAYEDPREHFKNFLDVCELFTFRGATQEAIWLRVFPFSLIGEASHWLVELSHDSISSREELTDPILERFLPASKMLSVCDVIMNY